jgi:hypothetical protein
LSSKKIIIVAVVFILLLAGAGAAIFLVLGNFEQLSEEGITFEKVPGYVALDGVSVPVSTVPDSFHNTNSINGFRGMFGLNKAII